MKIFILLLITTQITKSLISKPKEITLKTKTSLNKIQAPRSLMTKEEAETKFEEQFTNIQKMIDTNILFYNSSGDQKANSLENILQSFLENLTKTFFILKIHDFSISDLVDKSILQKAAAKRNELNTSENKDLALKLKTRIIKEIFLNSSGEDENFNNHSKTHLYAKVKPFSKNEEISKEDKEKLLNDILDEAKVMVEKNLINPNNLHNTSVRNNAKDGNSNNGIYNFFNAVIPMIEKVLENEPEGMEKVETQLNEFYEYFEKFKIGYSELQNFMKILQNDDQDFFSVFRNNFSNNNKDRVHGVSVDFKKESLINLIVNKYNNALQEFYDHYKNIDFFDQYKIYYEDLIKSFYDKENEGDNITSVEDSCENGFCFILFNYQSKSQFDDKTENGIYNEFFTNFTDQFDENYNEIFNNRLNDFKTGFSGFEEKEGNPKNLVYEKSFGGLGGLMSGIMNNDNDKNEILLGSKVLDTSDNVMYWYYSNYRNFDGSRRLRIV